MKTVAEYARLWLDGLSAELLDHADAEKFILEAVREYQAWGCLKSDKHGFDGVGEYTYTTTEPTAATELHASEWGVIKPLAELFAERERALIQEASRIASHEPYGRGSSEIAQDIQNYRNEYFRKQAFAFPPHTV